VAYRTLKNNTKRAEKLFVSRAMRRFVSLAAAWKGIFANIRSLMRGETRAKLNATEKYRVANFRLLPFACHLASYDFFAIFRSF
jgi:hypothetical protein